ncbi:winged helix-turn-helix transcriptional regulator [Pseudomonas syringae pv. coryli]|uniref:winged helix-turn-helix transcriptional regulator n=1 Tax=Pseudomonas syringae pv. coryli TaxID=317659 RepID=UPI001F1B807B|nr:winged helix-turn-helix transcriptional regulator [Pseudomonas syringae pv. coryli]
MSGGPRRFGELHADILGISVEMPLTLKEIEERGIVVRTVLETLPPFSGNIWSELGWSYCRRLTRLTRFCISRS